MNSKYTAWLEAHKPMDVLGGAGRCFKYSRAMAEAFPELRLVAGYHHDPLWKDNPRAWNRQHWWCVSPEGDILDPTADQFPSRGRGVYEELKPEERPVGRCMDCGMDVFRLDKDGNPNKYAPTFCNEACCKATEQYMRTGVL